MENFEYTSKRLERDEYRNKFRIDDDTEWNRKKPKNKTDYLVRLMLLQCLICGLIVSGIFIASKISPSFFEKIKEDYAEIMLRDMTAGEFAQDIKNAAGNVFSGADILSASSGEYTVESFEVTGDETGETVAVGEIVSEGSGGEDIQVKEAAKGTSFAPYYVSVSPVVPVQNARITSEFGYRTNPVSGKYGFHTGIDLAADEGTPVAASFYGKIIETGSSDVWGNYILMEHSENFQTYYCHLSEIYVSKGAVIRQGETVGLVGSTGWSTGPHLHFEVRINGVRVNPASLLYPDNGNEG
ncbi:MAG: M23 family metallopeptidase [Clostridia bacterium]|nr:M23 family metallopeptidase [Clostridia bacterium]